MRRVKSVSQHVASYERHRPTYEAFSLKLKELLNSILDANKLKVHSIESRAKTIESFQEKVTRSGKVYNNPLSELHDLCGCRIITYYADEVGKVADILKAEFSVIEEELGHQVSELDVDRFGYLSVHYVIKVGGNRVGLPEWRAFESMCAEVQIRTIIQHAWSAISHFIQYKQETAVPSHIQRRLYRIAGLFELADEEFLGIRDQKAALKASAAKAIAEGRKGIPLSSSSISEAIKAWSERDAALSAAVDAGFQLLKDQEDIDSNSDNYVGYIYSLATRLNINTVDDLLLIVNKVDLSLLETVFSINKDKVNWMVSENFIFYMLLIAAAGDAVDVEYLSKNGISAEIAKLILRGLRMKPRSRRRGTKAGSE
ncbi:hypothetical protein V3H18_09215 [Methylocystis sp. 9N]|uniref:RelA/SpoT domain-containing protein n=1 Tax=Methylocystis borbori TaxID=3118750 RepID=A0ABU7XH45_9HYPH